MSTPKPREYRGNAAAQVRQQRNSLRRHWLSAALVFLFAGLCGYMGYNLHNVNSRLAETQAQRVGLVNELKSARRQNERLTSDLSRVTDDSYMELMAKAMGFIYPQEAVHQPVER